jgi:phosphoribosylamine--glycine ligase
MLKILLHINNDEGFCLINRLQSEGHIVHVWLESEEYEKLYDGIVEKSFEEEYALDFEPDVIVFDSTGDGPLADKLERKGYMVFGAGKFNDQIEDDRDFGLSLMKKAKIMVPPSVEFKSIDKAIDFVKKNQKRYVLKVNETGGNYFPAYVSKGVEDMIVALEHQKEEKLMVESEGFILQEFIKGYEISIEGWFNGKEFIPELYNHCLEDKNFMPGNLGPSIGNAGCIIAGGNNIDPKSIAEMEKLVPYLRKNDYRGAIDLAFIVDDKNNYWGLEFCARIGYVSIEPLMEVYDGDFGELLYAIVTGNYPSGRIADEFGIGVRLTIPPYPMEIPIGTNEKLKRQILDNIGKCSRNLRILGCDDFYDSCYLSGIKMGDDGSIRVAAESGYLGAVCARAKTIDKAQKIVYDRLDKIILPDKQYRIDIGDRAKEWFKEKGKVVEENKLSEDSIASLSIGQKMEMQPIEIEDPGFYTPRIFSRGFNR